MPWSFSFILDFHINKGKSILFNRKIVIAVSSILISSVLGIGVHASPNLVGSEGVVTDSQNNLQWQDNDDANGREVKSETFILPDNLQ